MRRGVDGQIPLGPYLAVSCHSPSSVGVSPARARGARVLSVQTPLQSRTEGALESQAERGNSASAELLQGL